MDQIKLTQFVKMLGQKNIIWEELQECFFEVAEEYQITRVLAKHKKKDEDNSQSIENIVFDAGEMDAQIAYNYVFESNLNEKVAYLVERRSGVAELSTDEICELDMLFGILALFYEKQTLAVAVEKVHTTDYLTGVPNSAGFLKHVDNTIHLGKLGAYNGYYFNLRAFSLVNKRFGTKETDQIVYRYTKELVNFIETDECIGRLGGDNFVALIRKEKTKEFLELISCVNTYGIMAGRKIPLSIDAVAGAVELDDTITDCGTVINDCAMALNVAKNVLKKPVVFVSQELKDEFLKRRKVESLFMDAINKGEFRVYYQPKVDTKDFSLIGAEALVRWKQDDALKNPGEFIPILEKNESICILDFYVLEQVCKDIRDWKKMGMEPVRVSINFSRKNLSNSKLAEDILAILDKYEIDSRYIEIEVTETVNETEQDKMVLFMDKLEKAGVALAIDDFGTGYSSLNLLRKYSAVNVLKIDKSFIDDITKSDKIVLENIIHMATELAIDVIAEGVERWNQLKLLQEINCNAVQGYLFDRPMSKDFFERRLRLKKYDIEEIHDVIDTKG